MSSLDISYSYDHVPTIRRFSKSNKRIRAIMGPIGSGKSTGCVIEIIRRAKRQKPANNGVRYSRWLVVRNTYPELKDTTIRTFHDWIPPKYFGKYNQTDHNFIIDKMILPDGTRVHCEIMFRALDRPEHVSHLLSLELTGAWLNEVREIPKIIFDGIDTRINRYPNARMGGITWTGIIMDTNPPDTDHWFYKYFEEGKTEDMEQSELFRQPSGVSKEAENIPKDGSALPVDYYKNLMVGKDPEFIKVYVHGEYGYVQDGMPVYRNYVDSMHCSKDILKPVPGLGLILGWDFGVRNSACVICQLHPNGKFRILREFVAEDMGIRTLAREVVRPELATTYKGHSVYSIGDPAGTKRTDTDERTCYEELREAGFETVAAKSNSLQARYEAVNSFLMRQVSGHPALELCPSCRMLRKGFNGAYKYRRLQVSGDEIYHNIPEKNKYSHPHDALQYAAMFLDASITVNTESVYNQTQGRQEPVPTFAWT